MRVGLRLYMSLGLCRLDRNDDQKGWLCCGHEMQLRLEFTTTLCMLHHVSSDVEVEGSMARNFGEEHECLRQGR